MGHVNTVSGHIREAFCGFGGDADRRRLMLNSNRRVIRDLPAVDEYPSLSRAMFAITDGGERSSTQYRGRVIHFGASYSQVVRDFAMWRDKFENLLCRLYWDAAMVTVQTEYWGPYVFEWNAVTASRDGFIESPPRPVSEWRFRAWHLGAPPRELSSDDVDALDW